MNETNNNIYKYNNNVLNGEVLFQYSITPMMIVDSSRTIIKVNNSFCTLFEYNKEELIGNKTIMLTPSPEHFEIYKQTFDKTLEGSIQSNELLYKKKYGTLFWVKLSGIPITDNGEGFIIWSFDDITKEIGYREELKNRARELEIIFDRVNVGLVYVVNGLIERANQYFLSIINDTSDNIVGRKINIFLDCFDKCKTYKSKLNKEFHFSSGETIITEIEIVPINKDCYIMLLSDITTHAKEKASLTKLAQYDGLTGIYNRRTFTKFAREMILNELYNFVSFLFFDIDHFKVINDTYGHDIGDDVLIEISKLIKKMLRKDEIFGRLGGEEFGIILPLEKVKAVTIAERILNAVRNHTFTYKKLNITISIGLVDNKFSNIFETMYKEADRLMYIAKQTGRNRLVYVY